MDDKDVNEQTRDRLQVKADIEGGRSKLSRGSGGDALLLAIAPRHETVARRILRRMGWREGGGVGRERQAGSGARGVNRVSRVRKRPAVAAALPPSMQALLDEDDEETQLAAHDAITATAAAHDDETTTEPDPAIADDDNDDDYDTPLPSDVPLFQPPLKDDFYGLGYDALHGADEFIAHRTKQQQQQTQQRRHAEEAARDAALIDDNDDDVVELVRGGTARGGRGGRGRGGGVPGFRVMDDVDEMDEDELEVYEDRAEYDTHIGRLKRDKTQQPKPHQQEEKEEAAVGYGELVFVKGEVGGVTGGEVGTAWDVPRDWNERKVWDEAEEALEHERMKAVVREWADRRKAQLRARQEEVREMQQQQRRTDEKKESNERPQQQQPALPQPPPPLAAPPPVQSTADMLASGFFSRFTMAAPTASSTSPSPHLPLPPPPPAPTAATGPLRKLKREVLVWDPSPLLCRRLGVDPPPRRENATKSTTDPSTARSSNSQAATKLKHRQRQYEAQRKEEAEATQLHAPVIATDRPPTAVLSAIFDDADDRGAEERSRIAQQQWLEAEAMRLLSSIVLPGHNTAPIAGPPFASANSAVDRASASDQPAVSGYVHPSRQQHVQSVSIPTVTASSTADATSFARTLVAPPVASTSVSTVHPSRLHIVPAAVLSATSAAAALLAPRRSRWGDRVEAAPGTPVFAPPLAPAPPLTSSTLLSPSSSPPPLGPPTPPSMHRSLPPTASAAPPATAALGGGSVAQKAALKAALLKELAQLEQQSERERKEGREKRHKERKRERRHSRGSSSGRREKHRHSGGERRHSRRSRNDDSDSESRSSDLAVRSSPPRGRAYSMRETDVVDLT